MLCPYRVVYLPENSCEQQYQNTAKNTGKSVSPPPPKASPSPRKEEVEAKFRDDL
ncbi:MAG: hypothetical protein ACYTXA_15760 [Nostoc sp.]